MRLVFKKLSIENFMSIGQVDIDFDQMTGFNTIIGENYMVQDNAKSNGSGKSSIFEALIWCLTGETIRGNKDVVNHNTEGGTCVSVSFDCDGHSYVIERYKNHHKFKTNLLINVNGEDKSGKGIRDTEKLLEGYLPELTASLIGSVIVLGQGLPSRFTNNTPSARKEVLEKLTQSDFMIEDIRTHVMERKYDLSVALRECQDEMLSCKTLSTASKAAIKEIEYKLVDLADIDSKHRRMQELKEILASHKQNKIKYGADHAELDAKVKELTDEYNSLDFAKNNELLVLKNEHAEKTATLQAEVASAKATIQALEQKISSAKRITDVCPTCHQKLPGVFVPDTTEDEAALQHWQATVLRISNEVQNLYEEYKVQKWTAVENKYKDRLHELVNLIAKVSASRSEAMSNQATAEDAIQTVERMILSLQSEIDYCEITKNNLIKDMQAHEQKLTDLASQIRKLEEEEISNQQHAAVVNKFETIIKRDFRGYLLQDIIVYIDKRSKEYCKTIFNTDLIDFVLDGNNISITYNGKSYEALSGGERQKVDIIVQFAIRDVLCAYTGFHTNIIVLDEIFDNLDDIGSRKVIDLISHQLSDISAIFIISHHAKELNLPYDRELIIRKDENGVSNLA